MVTMKTTMMMMIKIWIIMSCFWLLLRSRHVLHYSHSRLVSKEWQQMKIQYFWTEISGSYINKHQPKFFSLPVEYCSRSLLLSCIRYSVIKTTHKKREVRLSLSIIYKLVSFLLSLRSIRISYFNFFHEYLEPNKIFWGWFEYDLLSFYLADEPYTQLFLSKVVSF